MPEGKTVQWMKNAGHTSIQAIFIDPPYPFSQRTIPQKLTTKKVGGGQYKQPINNNLRD